MFGFISGNELPFAYWTLGCEGVGLGGSAVAGNLYTCCYGAVEVRCTDRPTGCTTEEMWFESQQGTKTYYSLESPDQLWAPPSL